MNRRTGKKLTQFVVLAGIIGLLTLIIVKMGGGDKIKAQLLEQDIAKQIAATEILKDDLADKVNHFIESVETKTELVVLTETGSFDLEHTVYSDDWNKWFTTSKLFMTVDYSAIVTIPTNMITLTNVNNVVYASFNNDSFKTKSVELTDKNILTDRSMFGKVFTDEDKIALESLLVKEIKTAVLSEANLKTSNETLKEYLRESANKFGVSIVFN